MRIGIVGYGAIAPRHAEALRGVGATIVAASSRSAANRARAEADGIPSTFDDPREMIRRSRLDGIVCTPVFDAVAEVTARLIPFRIPLLVEKPPGTSLGEYRSLVDLAMRHDTPTVVGLNRRHYSSFAAALRDAGGVGALTSVQVDWSEDPGHVLKRFDVSRARRWIFGNSLHGIDILTTLAGPVSDVTLVTRHLGEPLRWMMSLQGIGSRGALATFHSTWDSPGRWRVVLCAPNKRYVCQPIESCTVLERGQAAERTLDLGDDDVRFKPGFLRQARVFADVIRSGRGDPNFDLQSAEPAMVLAEALTSRFCA